MSGKYYGSLNKLKKYVKSTGIKGGWNSGETGKHIFRSESGGILNWWPSSGTVNFQGAANAKNILEKSLKNMLSSENAVSAPTRTAIENDCTEAFDDANWSEDNHQGSSRDYSLDNSLKGLNASDQLLKRVNKALSEYGLFVMLRDEMLCVVSESESEWCNY